LRHWLHNRRGRRKTSSQGNLARLRPVIALGRKQIFPGFHRLPGTGQRRCGADISGDSRIGPRHCRVHCAGGSKFAGGHIGLDLCGNRARCKLIGRPATLAGDSRACLRLCLLFAPPGNRVQLVGKSICLPLKRGGCSRTGRRLSASKRAARACCQRPGRNIRCQSKWQHVCPQIPARIGGHITSPRLEANIGPSTKRGKFL
jgi:hypothetical protein